MKRLQKIEGVFASSLLLLSLSAIPQPFTESFKIVSAASALEQRNENPVLAQSAPTLTSPQTADPTRATEESGFMWLWWLLIPLWGGLVLWSINRRSHPTSKIEPATGAVDPVAPVVLEAGASSHDDRQPPDIALDRERLLASNGQQKVGDAAVTQRVDQTIQLLEERLVVNLHQRKVGEVIVRKEIETRIVEVPIRREKLIVEQVSPEFKQLAVIDLGQMQEIDTVAAAEIGFLPTVEAKFTSTTAAMQFLQEIERFSEREAAPTSSSLQPVQMNIVLKDADAQAVYQHWLEHDSNRPISSVAV